MIFDDGLTFYRLQAHFFSVNAEVIHGRVAVFTKENQGANPEDGKARVSKRSANAREQSQESVGHA
jgi:hypothetical protein